MTDSNLCGEATKQCIFCSLSGSGQFVLKVQPKERIDIAMNLKVEEWSTIFDEKYYSRITAAYSSSYAGRIKLKIFELIKKDPRFISDKNIE